MPPDKRKHNEIAHRIYQERTRILGGSDSHTLLGTAFIEMGYRFTGHTWLQPDVSITHQGQGGDDYFRGAPALAVEVVSERNTADQIDGKVAEYLAGGGLEAWVLCPKKQHCAFTGQMAQRSVGGVRKTGSPGASSEIRQMLGIRNRAAFT